MFTNNWNTPYSLPWVQVHTAFTISIILSLMSWSWPGGAQEPPEQFSKHVQRAIHATIGILAHADTTEDQASLIHFSVRGSGVHIGKGYLLTARHAVTKQQGGKQVAPTEISILTGNLEELPAQLVGMNAFLDLAVYRLLESTPLPDLATATFSDREPEPGDQVFTVGYPLGWGPAVGYGRLGNPNTFLPRAQSRLFQIDLSACSGNSGGGLFNAQGDLVGIVKAIIQTETSQTERRCSRFAFAVPGALLQRVATALIEGRAVGFSRLGVRMTVVKRGARWRVAVSKATGPAQKGGIQKGDILLSIDDTAITSPAQLKTYLIEHTTPGQHVTLRLRRGEEEQYLSVTLGTS